MLPWVERSVLRWSAGKGQLMRIFLSWSGPISQQIATRLHDWLPNVLQYVEPFLSSEDIDKGARWLSSMMTELQACHFGLICLTPDNLTAQWMHFEAGALSKTIDRSRVMPILFKLQPSDVQGPLAQFQMVSLGKGKEEVYRLLKSIDNIAGDRKIEEDRLEKVFVKFWADLDSSIGEMLSIPPQEIDTPPSGPPDRTRAILEEVLVLVRQQATTAADTLPFIVGSLQGNVGVLRDMLNPSGKVALERS
jgi:TIR domain